MALQNPYRPGAGHMPPHLAGRKPQLDEFRRLLTQETILENMVLTGLRGVGKTVLLETFKPEAIKARWLWVGTDLSESTSISDENMALRILTDLSVVTSAVPGGQQTELPLGFSKPATPQERTLNFTTLRELYAATPGLVVD